MQKNICRIRKEFQDVLKHLRKSFLFFHMAKISLEVSWTSIFIREKKYVNNFSEGFQDGLNYAPMMQRGASLRGGCTPDRCTFSSPKY